MASFKYTDSIDDIIENFEFLVKEYSFHIINQQESNFGFKVEYSNGIIRIHLYYDYRDNFFYFKIIRGTNTAYPNDNDNENIKTFYDIIDKYNLGIAYNLLQPNKDQYINALKLNAKILKEHGNGILKGEEWF